MEDKFEIYSTPADIAANYDANGSPTDDPPQIAPYRVLRRVTLATPAEFIQLSVDGTFTGAGDEAKK
jgi:hypothetical protein